MFYDCTALTSFSSDLSSLTDGTEMFNVCPNLENFDANLSSLTNGEGMFGMCCLNKKSVLKIAKTIRYWAEQNPRTHYITIGIDKSLKDDDEVN
jgi:hypothetical protein